MMPFRFVGRCFSIACSTALGERLNVAGSISANTGRAPHRVMELAEAKNVKGVVKKLSPGPTPIPARASHRASVPDEHPTVPAAPRYSDISRSRDATSSPSTSDCDSQTWSMAARTSSRMVTYWRLRSSMGTGVTCAAEEEIVMREIALRVNLELRQF